MNRASRPLVIGLIIALVCLAGTAAPQTAGSTNPDQKKPSLGAKKPPTTDKKPSDKTVSKVKEIPGDLGTNAGSKTRAPLDSGSQAAIQSQIKGIMTTQGQQAEKLDSLKRELESLKKDRISQQEIDSLNQKLGPALGSLTAIWRLALVGSALAMVALISITLVFVFKINPLAKHGEEMRRQNNELRESLNVLREDIQQLKRGRQNFVTVDNFEDHRKAVERLQLEISKLTHGAVLSRGRIEPEEELPNWRSPEPRTQQQVVRDFTAVAAAQARVTTFYADLPDRDGCFKDLKDKAEWNSLYKLTLEDSDSATVEIHSGSERFDAAMKAAQQYLSPVCEYQSNPPASAKRINQVSSGKAVREGQAWKVTEKLKVEFV